ncbi:hypothetical protein [Geodermatophilus sabuli]|uniref:Tyr recombinase domain-containing protein n=1 Tax=Geodermatophilus sabuli TaxID=1564158 RepID=A0A285EEN0_9ACTN|nr:hypothetical protein [Geodermatophilus sabuli]MBB3084229.1 hypothetical protein [Geodermatophilus sabuli]SNX96501.1 hypothetical protein SAMN06893097_104216 [Geodermatophilus sabuli]
MTVTPHPDAPSPDPLPEGGSVPGRFARGSARIGHLTLEEFHAAYALAVSTGDDPALDGLLLQHLLIEAARPAELLSLRYGDLDPIDAIITVWDSRPFRSHRRPSTPEHVAALAAHVAERGPRTPAPPDAPEEVRRAGIPALSGDDPVFYRRPVDTFDADGYLVDRQVRPMTGRRLTSLVVRIRQNGGPALTASVVRALSIRLIWSAGGGEAVHWFGPRSAPRTVLDAEAARQRLGRLKSHLFGDLPEHPAGDHPGGTDC